MSEYESHYESGGGMLMTNNETGYGYHNNVSGSKMQSSSNSVSSMSSNAKTSFFQSSNQSKYDDLKQMLESSKELLKLEAMKRIITMVAKGRSAESARELFPHVVKNVVTKNTELKKLVYLYLTRYAEQEQDLALLSIATFQHALKDPNPLIRGSAIRVLSSIRVPMICPIVLIAIKDCANDMSPYVRKTAAHAIPKLVSLDADIKDEVIDIIAKLLADKVSLVLGSAVAAFEQVCPDRFDLIHENYRKLCQLLVDVDEWGQILIINMLMRYARTQFVNPNQWPATINNEQMAQCKIDPDHMLLIRSVKPLLQSRNSGVVLAVIQLYLSVGPHFEISASLVRPLIRLLHSHYEIQLIILKNIVTLTSNEFNQKWLRDNNFHASKSTSNNNATSLMNDQSSDSFQPINGTQATKECESSDETESGDEAGSSVVMRTIKSLFEPYLKSFFVKANDSTQIKILKLEILTNLSNTGNYISLILREFQAYIQNYQDDLEFMSATIQSIGQCASRIKQVAPVCLNGLVSLLSNRNETIVAQSIVVIRTQMINKDDSIISMIVKQIVKLMDKISTPQARATIVWIVAEFNNRNKHAHKLAPNVLLQIAKSFTQEHDLVKLQALNLAAKLYITMMHQQPDLSFTNLLKENDKERLKVLINYVFNLAKYDLNYDVRDRGRFLKQLINHVEIARRILLLPKQVPNVQQCSQMIVQRQQSSGNVESNIHPTNNTSLHLASSIDSSRYRFGTLSHFIGKKLVDYEELPDYPETAPDPSVRKQLEPVKPSDPLASANDKYRLRPRNGFISDSDYDDDDDDDDDEDDDDDDEVDDDDDDENQNDDEDEDSEQLDKDEDQTDEEVSEQESENQDEENEDEEDYDEDDGEEQTEPIRRQVQAMDLLLDLSDLNIGQSSSINCGLHEPLLPLSEGSNLSSTHQPYRILQSSELVTYREFELLHVPYQYKVTYRFPRINQAQRTLVELVIKSDIQNDQINENNCNRITIQPTNNSLVQFINVQCQDNVASIDQLGLGETRLVSLSVDFNESPSMGIELQFNRQYNVKLVAPLGDILYPVRFHSIEDFKSEQSKLTGMNQVFNTVKIDQPKELMMDEKQMHQRLNQIMLNLANVCTNQHLYTSEDNGMFFYYSACTVKFRSLILIAIQIQQSDDSSLTLSLIVNCEKMVIGSLIAKLIKDECLKQF